jgi:hypothetical protein
MRNFIFYTFNLFRLKAMTEADQMTWLYNELRSAKTPPRNSRKRLRLLHCADLPIELRKSASKDHSQNLRDFQDLALYAFNGTLTPKENESRDQAQGRMESLLRRLSWHEKAKVDEMKTWSFEQKYPRITELIKIHGRIEMGQIDGSSRFILALDEGGTIWEGKVKYASIDEALEALEEGLANWRPNPSPQADGWRSIYW